jgi:Uma2 family endonuclease
MSTTLDEPRTTATPLPGEWTMADLQEFLGNVPARRIRMIPYPGTATEDDALRIRDREGRLYELVDGILVEKDTVAYYESLLAGLLIHWINGYLDENPRGVVAGEGGPLQILPTRMRIPDVSVILWERFPNRRLPAKQRVYRVVPDLAVEILSEGNTPAEMDLKRDEYLEAGVQLIWYIAPRTRTAIVYRSDGSEEAFDENGVLSGGAVLPGFELHLREFFNHFPLDEADQPA